MGLYWVIFVVLLISVTLRFKRTLLLYVPLKLILHRAVLLMVSPQVVELSLAVDLYIVFLFFFRRGFSSYKDFPLKWSFVFMALTIAISSIMTHYLKLVATTQILVSHLFMVYVLWEMIEVKADVIRITRNYFYVVAVICFFGLTDFLFSFNPILDYFTANSPDGFISPNNEIRFGFRRIKGLMPHAITFGVVCAMMLSFFLYYYQRFPEYLTRVKSFILPFFALLIAGVFLSNSRSSVITSMIGLMFLLTKKNVLSYKGFGALVLVMVVGFVYADVIMNMFNSLSSNSSVSGSSFEMRELQLEAILAYFYKSPIWGNGYGFVFSLIGNDSDLYGAESIWFYLLGDLGLLGLMSYVFYYISVYSHLSFKGSKVFVFFFTGAWIAANTMTSLPGIDISLFFYLVIILYKTRLFEEYV